MLILVASSRSDGNTAAIVERLVAKRRPLATAVIDLSLLGLRLFSYEERLEDDGFRSVIGKIIQNGHIVFATPV